MPILNAFNGIFTIIALISVGVVLAKKLMNQEIYNFCSRLLMQFCVPMLLFENAIKNVTWDFISSMGIMLLVPFVLQLVNYAVARLCAILFKIPKNQHGIFTAIFAVSNTIFIGLPVTIAIYGEVSVPFVTACFISNTLCFWSLIVPGIAADGGSATVSRSKKLKQVFSPPLLAFFAGSIFNLVGLKLPVFLTSAITYLGGMVTPLSMILIAFLLTTMGRSVLKPSRTVVLGLIGRFLIVPVIAVVGCVLFKVPSDIAKVFSIVATMPVMNQAVILASTYKANDKAVAQALAFSCLIGIAAIPLMVFILELIFII